MSSTEEYQQEQFWKEGRTISKHFDDSEIIGRLPNGDLYLQPGVKRLKYDSQDPNELETHINYTELTVRKITDKKNQTKDWDE